MKWLFEPHSPFPSEARQLALGSAAWLVQELVRFASKEPEVTSLLCDTTNIPDGMRLIGFKEVNEYDKISYIECVSYQVAILEDEFGVRHEYFVPTIHNSQLTIDNVG